MSEVSRPVPSIVDDFVEWFERRESAQLRLARSRDEHPVACAMVMAAWCWEQLDPRGWRAPEVLGVQARRLMAAWGLRAEALDDTGQVASALKWASRDPALLERDEQGRYRLVTGLPLTGLVPTVAADKLTPLERVITGDADRYAEPPNLDTAEVSYRLAVDSDDPDAAAFASLRLAELADQRDEECQEESEQAPRQYADVAALGHPFASPPAVLWLARRAARDGDQVTARALAHEVISGGVKSLRVPAWDLVASAAWLDKDTDAAVAAMRLAVEAAGEWHGFYSRRLAEMLAACGKRASAAEVYRGLLDEPLLYSPDAGRYAQLMIETGQGQEAIAVLERYVAVGGLFAGELLLALASLRAACDDLDGCRRALEQARAHPSAALPQMLVRIDMVDASLAIAEHDDDRAARLYRSLTDTDDTERRNLARPLLIGAGDEFAAAAGLCVISGAQPLLEYLSEAAPPVTAVWAAKSLAHLAVEQGRPDDAEAAVRLAARYLSSDEVTVLRALLLDRGGNGCDALAHLLEAAVVATLPALAILLPAIALVTRGVLRLNTQQRRRLRAAVKRVLSASNDEDDLVRARVRVAMAAMTQIELRSRPARNINRTSQPRSRRAR